MTAKKKQSDYPNLKPDDDPGATRLKFSSMMTAKGTKNEYAYISVENPEDAIGWMAIREREGFNLLAIVPGSYAGHGVYGHIGITIFFVKATKG